MEKLIIENLSYSYGYKEVLKDISFSLEKGKSLSILGPSGAGKTTLLHLCANLINIDKGKIENSFKTSSFAFQEPRLLPWKNAIDNIAIALIAKGENKKTSYNKACSIALTFGLNEDDFKKFPKDLSGGMKQRVSFARALAVNPSLLFLDEPFSALDIGLKRELKNHLLKESLKEQMSILFITHDPMDAIALSDEIILLDIDPGKIAARFKIDKNKNERDDKFVYLKTVELLNEKIVKNIFELDKI